MTKVAISVIFQRIKVKMIHTILVDMLLIIFIIGTYFTTSHELVVQPNGYINITITFIEGATMVEAFKGCLINTTCNTCNEQDKKTIFPVTDYYINLGPFMPGEYSIYIYDYYNGQYHSSDPPVITDTFSISSTTISNTAVTASQSPTPTC